MSNEKKDIKNETNSHIKMGQLTILDTITQSPGVDTLEGRIGPLLSGVKGAAHYIVMPPDMYCDPHTHPTESIIYTAKGEWVLYGEGRRHHMKEGSLFFMPADIETGYEVPFDKPATLLIIKFQGPTDPSEFLAYLEGLKHKLEAQKAVGEIFNLSALPEYHPARVFAREIVSKTE